MQKWEYEEIEYVPPEEEENPLGVTTFRTFQNKLCDLGREGWECYAVTTDDEYNKTYYLKRPFYFLDEKKPSN